jgi:hypothetical protein
MMAPWFFSFSTISGWVITLFDSVLI